MSLEDTELSFEEKFIDPDEVWLPEDNESFTEDENNEPLYQLGPDRANRNIPTTGVPLVEHRRWTDRQPP